MFNGEEKVTYNADKLVSVHLIVKETHGWYPTYKPPRKGSFWKLQFPRKKGYFEGPTFYVFQTAEEILNCKDYENLIVIEDNVVYTKPYIKLRFVDGQSRNYFCETELEAQLKYDFFANQIKNPLLR